MAWHPDGHIEIARQAVKETLSPKAHMRCHCREKIDAGEWDEGHKVQACLRAIQLTRTALKELEPAK